MKKLMTTIMVSLLFTVGCSQECEEPSNVWYKLSNEQGENYGKILQLDMSKGMADTDGTYLYLFVKDVNGEGIVIMFPFGYWETEKVVKDPFLEELEKEFKNLEDYLKSQQGKGIEIKK
mgnify:FL=1